MRGLCIYVDGGKGHYVPAKAVAEELEKMGAEVRLEEFFRYLDIRFLGRINKHFWRTMLRMPSLEQRISRHNDSDSNGMELAVRFANRFCMRRLMAELDRFRPDFVFATHPYASTIISEMFSHEGIEIPVYYFATDVFSAPVASICDKLRKFYISTEEGLEKVMSMGQPRHTLELSPFPLQHSVAGVRSISKDEARKRLGLDPSLFTLQINLGGEGLGSLYLLESLISRDIPMQIVVIGGMEKAMMKRLDGIVSRARRNVKVYNRGFVSNVDEYLAASDIIAGRAGINTIVEAMYARRPFLITELVYTVIPSADYVEKYKVGWNCSGKRGESVDIVISYAEAPGRLMELEHNFDAVPIVYSAEALARTVVEDAIKAHSENVT